MGSDARGPSMCLVTGTGTQEPTLTSEARGHREIKQLPKVTLLMSDIANRTSFWKTLMLSFSLSSYSTFFFFFES